MNVLVQGVGGIGGILLARLLSAGIRVTPVTGNEAIAKALNQVGVCLEQRAGPRWIPLAVPACATVPPQGGPYDVIVVATQSAALGPALEASSEHLSAEGVVVCCQNGLPEDRAAAVVGPDRVLGAVVSWGGSMVSPGRYMQTSPGAIQLGRPDGRVDEAVGRAARLLGFAGEVRVTSNLAGVRWSKLALNSAITTLGAIGGEPLGVILRHADARRLALEIFTELCAVARAHRIRLEKVSGTLDLDRIALPQHARPGPSALLWRHALLIAVGLKYRRVRSSMLYALERGRAPEVDYLNGEIVRRAGPLGIPTPVNCRLIELVHEIARGERTSGMEHLQDACRQLIRS